MKQMLTSYFGFVVICMLAVTGWASSQESVFAGGGKLMSQPWGIATLADTYFGFLAFYIWVVYKESSLVARVGWLAAILLLGNIAMAVYALVQIRKAHDNSFVAILLRAEDRRPA